MSSGVRAFALTLGMLLAWALADAQAPPRVPRIGSLYSLSPDACVENFRQGLKELGHVEGQSVAVEYRYAEGKTDRYAALAAEVVGLKPDVIAVAATGLVQAVGKATQTIPVVFMFADQPVEAGLVASLARPGGNVTGLTTLGFDLIPKRLELLRDAVPKVTRVAVLWSAYPPVPRVLTS